MSFEVSPKPKRSTSLCFKTIIATFAFLACPFTSPAQILAFEAESGGLGTNYANTNDGTAQYIAIQTDYLDLESPGSSNRVATYNLVFPAPGTYNLYARVRVGPDGDKDDSFFYANSFGLQNPTDADLWNRVNNLVQGGYSNPGDIVADGGTAGIGIWKWLNLSQFTNIVTEPPATFTVPSEALSQLFQIGARENGLDIDKLVFATAANTYTVAQLDAFTSTGIPRDFVNGNLVQFSDNGAWCWYQDERAVVDTLRSKLVVGYVQNGTGFGGTNIDGRVCATIFDLNSRTGLRYTLKDKLFSYGAADDHNAPALLVRPDGKYLAIYTGHNNDNYSFWRIYDPATDLWSDEQTFDWGTQPGGTDFPTTYSNLHYLPAENRTYDFSRGNGHGGQNFMFSTDYGNTWSYGGNTTTNGNVGYVNGYFRYMDNGRDRIDFICTEYHPRDFNTSIYHGYISNGMTFRSDGTVVDANIFDKAAATPQSFTPVFLASTVMPAGMTNYRCWNDDVQRYTDGSIAAIITSRVNNNVDGNDIYINPDHAFFYCRYNLTNWTTTYLGRAGAKLFSSEADYVGLGCLNPSDPNTIYISTPYDPRDNTTFLGVHEIFKGVTTNHGASFTWTSITRNSSRDNLRPIVPVWDQNHTGLIWYRGTYSTALSFDAALVGLLDRHDESVEPMTYVDAAPTNTFLTSTGAPLTVGPGANQWHTQTDAGNGGSVLSSSDTIAEDAPPLFTTITLPDNGSYDVWVNFWGMTGADWRITAGLSTNQMQVFRQMACKQVESGNHATSVVLSNGVGAFLYQAYLGRVTNRTVNVFIDDNAVQTGTANTLISDTARTWYDGVSYARVKPLQTTATANKLARSVTLSWNSVSPDLALSRLTYTVQKKNSLSDAGWITLATNLPSAGATTTFTESFTNNASAFYRIVSP